MKHLLQVHFIAASDACTCELG